MPKEKVKGAMSSLWLFDTEVGDRRCVSAMTKNGAAGKAKFYWPGVILSDPTPIAALIFSEGETFTHAESIKKRGLLIKGCNQLRKLSEKC